MPKERSEFRMATDKKIDHELNTSLLLATTEKERN